MNHFSADAAYFIRRASEEEAAAERASDPRARQSHIDLAERYSEAARAIASRPVAEQSVQAPPSHVPLLQPEFRILP